VWKTCAPLAHPGVGEEALLNCMRQHFHRSAVMLASARMPKGPVELRVGGQTYRVVATAEEADLHRLADVVDERLRSLTAPGRAVSPQSLLLAALSLAHDLEDERNRRIRSEQRAREMLSGLLARIDAALEVDSAEAAVVQASEGPTSLEEPEVEFDFGPGLEP
jgi:cell division protein ZapA